MAIRTELPALAAPGNVPDIRQTFDVIIVRPKCRGMLLSCCVHNAIGWRQLVQNSEPGSIHHQFVIRQAARGVRNRALPDTDPISPADSINIGLADL